MQNVEILQQIKDEYNLWYQYVRNLRELYRGRIEKRNPQNKKDSKININMIANAIDTKIASTWTNGLKVKFISSVWRIWEEQAENLTRVAEFDEKETAWQQIRYQLEQDSQFFGLWILNKTGFDTTKLVNTRRSVNPLSCIPDPLPSQTGQFDAQNYRFIGFMMRTNLYDMPAKYAKDNLNSYFQKQYDSEEQRTGQAYRNREWTWPITCDNLKENFAIQIYTHYTIVKGRKYKVVVSADFWHIFSIEELKPVTKEEKLNPLLVPRPVMFLYSDPMRESFLGNSICDKLEDKQNAKSILFNLNVIKAKKEAMGWDFLVNSRLIKNEKELKKSTNDTRYIFVDEDNIGDMPLQNAMIELPQSPIKSDTFAMMNAIDAEANKDARIDSMQQGIVSDKTMTKAEAQTVQANANTLVRKELAVKQWFYEAMYFQRWRWYLENMKQWQQKFSMLSSDFEWKGVTLEKDQFVTSQIPYIMIGTDDELNAINESKKQYLNQLLPQIINDPTIPEVSKLIFRRLVDKVNGLEKNISNIVYQYTPSERKAKLFVDMINMDIEPMWIFTDVNADYFTYYLYIQKANDWPIKDKILRLLTDFLMEQWQQVTQWGNNQTANSAANIMMSQNQPKQDVVSRMDLQPNQW